MKRSAVSIKNVSFAYGRTLVLKQVNFDIPEKQFVAIVGPNGGGKSTLLQLMMGFETPLEGFVSLFGKKPIEMRKEMGWVPQKYIFDKQFPMTVFDVVLMGLLKNLSPFHFFSVNDKKMAAKALEEVGLEGYHHCAFSELSGGQAQRVLLARALVGNPKLLFLDEATANMDVPSQIKISSILSNLKHKMTIFMVTHDLKSVMDLADNVLCVQKEVSFLSKEFACSHYDLGLYHSRSESLAAGSI